MSTHLFEYGDVKVTLEYPTEDTLFNKARYLVRLAVSRFSRQPISTARILFAPQFATILAHIQSAEGLPFEVPDPTSHPDAVGSAWDAYLDSDPELWDELINAVGLPDLDKYVERNFSQNMDRALVELEKQLHGTG